MKSDQAFPSKYLKAADFAGGKRPHFQVATVVSENVGREDKPEWKPVMYVRYNNQPIEKGIVMNQTNWGAIATDLGDESDAWVGHTIEFFSMRVQGPNGMTDGIRCRVIHPQERQPAPQPAQPYAPVGLTQAGNIPPSSAFRNQPAQPGPFGAEPPTAMPGSYGANPGPSGDIPFSPF